MKAMIKKLKIIIVEMEMKRKIIIINQMKRLDLLHLVVIIPILIQI